MPEPTPEIQRGRIEAIKRQFAAVVNSDKIKGLSAEYLRDKSRAEQVSARVTSSLHFRKNGWQFMFQHYTGGPGYEGHYRDSFSRFPILEDGSVGALGGIEILLREKMPPRKPIEEISGKEYTSGDFEDEPRSLSLQESIDKAEEVLQSVNPSLLN